MIVAFAEFLIGWDVRKLVLGTLPGRWMGRLVEWIFRQQSSEPQPTPRLSLTSREVLQIRLSLNVSGLEQTARFLPNLGLYGFTWTLQVLKPEPESHRGSTSESEAESNPKRNSRPPQGENLRRIP